MIPLDSIEPFDFSQYKIHDFTTGEAGPFDLTAEGLDMPPDFKVGGRFSQVHYNWVLLNRLLEARQQDVERFLEYQARLFRDPEMWLRDLRFLIKGNWEVFCGLGLAQVFLEIQGVVQMLERKYDSNAALIRYFVRKNSIDYVRSRLRQLKNYDVQVEFLLGRKQEYMNDRPPGYVEDGAPFDQLLDLELEKLKEAKEREEHMELLALQQSLTSNKLITDWSVNEIAFLFRVLYEAGLIPINNKMAFYKCAAGIFRSKHQDHISWKSFKNAFESPIGNAVDFWLENFGEIMEVVRRHKLKGYES